MGDEKDDIEVEDGADDGAKDDNVNNQGQDDGAGDADKANQDDKAKADDQSKAGGEDNDTPPPVRKTASDFYKERQAKKAAKANSQNDDDDGENEDDSDEDVDPGDEKIINKVVSKKFAPILEKIQAQEETQEANDFFKANEEFKPFEGKILKWWKDPSRRHLPIETVALEAVGYKNLLKIGAQREKEAILNAKKSSSGGAGSGNSQGKKPVAEMSREEFAAEKERVLRSRQ